LLFVGGILMLCEIFPTVPRWLRDTILRNWGYADRPDQ
jgi:hypothetical protein